MVVTFFSKTVLVSFYRRKDRYKGAGKFSNLKDKIHGFFLLVYIGKKSHLKL